MIIGSWLGCIKKLGDIKRLELHSVVILYLYTSLLFGNLLCASSIRWMHPNHEPICFITLEKLHLIIWLVFVANMTRALIG